MHALGHGCPRARRRESCQSRRGATEHLYSVTLAGGGRGVNERKGGCEQAVIPLTTSKLSGESQANRKTSALAGLQAVKDRTVRWKGQVQRSGGSQVLVLPEVAFGIAGGVQTKSIPRRLNRLRRGLQVEGRQIIVIAAFWTRKPDGSRFIRTNRAGFVGMLINGKHFVVGQEPLLSRGRSGDREDCRPSSAANGRCTKA